MTELWRPVPEYEGLYEVSDHGRVRGVDRYVRGRFGPRRQAGQLLSPALSAFGYPCVHLRRNRHGRTLAVHRLVLRAFIGEPPPGTECCHYNGNPTDNRLSNLRWDTASANQLDKVRHGTHHNAIKTHCKRGHELAGTNLRIEPNGRRRCRACSKQLLNERRRKARQELMS